MKDEKKSSFVPHPSSLILHPFMAITYKDAGVDIDAANAPTRIKVGSHLDVPPYLVRAGDRGVNMFELCKTMDADGKLDRAYPVKCYQNALDAMPEDMRSYTTAPDDIKRALLARLRTARTHHGELRGGSRHVTAAPRRTPTTATSSGRSFRSSSTSRRPTRTAARRR